MTLTDSLLLRLVLEDGRLREVLLSSGCPFLFSTREYAEVFRILKTYWSSYPGFKLSREKLKELLSQSSIDEELVLQELESVPVDQVRQLRGSTEKELDDLLLARAFQVYSLWCVRARRQYSPKEYIQAVRAAREQIPASFFEQVEIVSLSSSVTERLSFNFEVFSPFGIKTLDTLLQGGLFPGEAALIIGAKNVGKTFFGVNIAKWNAVLGNQVLFFTLETRKTFVLRRLDTSLFKFKPELYDRVSFSTKEDYVRFLRNLQRALTLSRQFLLGDVVVLDYPSYHLTTAQIKADIEKVESKSGRKVDTVVVDYLEIMKGMRKEEAKRMELASISNELRAIAQVKDCSVFVLSQGNKESRKALYVDSTHSSESWSKPFAFDFVLGLSEDTQDPNKRYVYLADSRRTPKKLAFVCETNFFVSQWREMSCE